MIVFQNPHRPSIPDPGPSPEPCSFGRKLQLVVKHQITFGETDTTNHVTGDHPKLFLTCTWQVVLVEITFEVQMKVQIVWGEISVCCKLHDRIFVVYELPT